MAERKRNRTREKLLKALREARWTREGFRRAFIRVNGSDAIWQDMRAFLDGYDYALSIIRDMTK